MYQGNLAPISNRADWFGTIELVNDDTGEIIVDLSGVGVFLEVRDRLCHRPVLKGSMDDGSIIDAGNGVIQWEFPASSMSPICAGSYELGIILTRDGATEQELIAILPIVDGVVRR